MKNLNDKTLTREDKMMKTVQEYLKILDKDKLMKMYMSRLCVNPKFFNSDDTRLFIKTHIKIGEYIKRLKTLKIQPTEDGSVPVLYVYETIAGAINFTENDFGLIHLDELKKDVENANDYAYEFQNQKEIMGYLVSNAPYTQENIYELMVDVMYEASFFGYENEHLEEERESLRSAIKEIEEGKCVAHNTSEEMYEDILGEDFSQRFENDWVAERLKDKAMDAIHKFNKYSKNTERKKLLELLEHQI